MGSQLLRIELYSYQANFIRYFFFFHKKMKISYLCLIVAIVIGLGTVTATPADNVKAVAADAEKFGMFGMDGDEFNKCHNYYKLMHPVREAADDVKAVAADAEELKGDECKCQKLEGDELADCINLCLGRQAADNVKAVAADDFKFFGLNREERAKCENAMGLVREAADEERQMAVLRN